MDSTKPLNGNIPHLVQLLQPSARRYLLLSLQSGRYLKRNFASFVTLHSLLQLNYCDYRLQSMTLNIKYDVDKAKQGRSQGGSWDPPIQSH